MPSLDLKTLSQSPEFLAASPEAKRLFLSKYVPEFARSSQEAQSMFVEKHFPRSATSTAPTRSFWSLAGESAARTSAPIVGGIAGGAVGGATAALAGPEAIPAGIFVGSRLGAGGASAGVSALYGDPGREIAAEGFLGAALPGPGKTVVRSVAKGAAFSAGATTLDEVARTGELPTKGHLALSAIIGGTIGWFGKALPDWLSHKLTSRYHIEEILPKDVAADAEKVLSGKPVANVAKEEIKDIRRAILNIKLQGKSGRFMSRTDVEKLRTGATYIRVLKPGLQRDPKGRFIVREQIMREVSKEDIFPPYNPAEDDIHRLIGMGKGPVPTTTEIHPTTKAFASWSRPRILAAHVQDQTGVMVYDDVYKPLRAAYGDRERTAVVVDHIISKYLKDRSLDPAVKDIIGRYTAAVNSQVNSREVLYVMKRLGQIFGKEIPEDTARRWTNNVLSAPYAAGIPFRPGSVLRVSSHTIQIGVMKTGWSGLVRGLVRATTPEGWREATRAGVIGAEHFSVPEEVLGAGKSWYRKALELGFGPFRFSQDLSRVTIFHATRERAKDAMRVAKTFEQFIDKAGLDVGIPRPEVEKARFLWNQGRFKELVDHVGSTHVDSYIPGHTNLDRPFFSSGVMSGQATAQARGVRPERFASPRFATQYLNWPSFYGQTLYENFREGPPGKRAIMAMRFLTANAALGVVAYELYGEGKKAMESAASLVGLGPTFYGLGPGIADIQGVKSGAQKMWTGAIETVVGDDADVGKKHVAQGFRQVGRSLPIPFKGAIKDLNSYLLGEEE